MSSPISGFILLSCPTSINVENWTRSIKGLFDFQHQWRRVLLTYPGLRPALLTDPSSWLPKGFPPKNIRKSCGHDTMP